ncbi:MAG TPA: RNA polymerase sigma factor [Amaricoccus sp.]|uniref:RNA polymerase sigma factor n=1 Tax=Amaricoccus sp. TaxID=1872485 RepID=UPI002BBE69EF|nr:RNA polymerase sigma factor [Amaricoccus sp.]HPG23660.1 RNA polymerase sigma factor [Amaricoccus sp.]HRW13817.1 RNA polymerase sigma factor [Amaricoccus sp.]
MLKPADFRSMGPIGPGGILASTSRGEAGLDSRFQSELVNLVPRLRRFAYALTGSGDAGDDLVQTACERALRHADQFRPGTRMDSWMFRIMQNLWLDDRRRQKVRGTRVDPERTELSDGGQSARRLDDRLTLARIRDAVDRLPDDQRAVLVLVAIEGLNYRETAEVLDLPMGTVMSRLSRARSRLLDIMDTPPEEARAWAR